MKFINRISLLLTLVCIGSFAIAQDIAAKKFTLDGRLTGKNTKYVYLQYYNYSKKQAIIDTARVINGRFSFQGYIDEPTGAFVIDEKSSESGANANKVVIYLDPAPMHITLEEDRFENAVVTGSKTQSEQEALNRAKAALEAEYAPLDKQFAIIEKLLASGSTDELQAERSALLKKFEPQKLAIKEIDLEFISHHSDSFLAPSLLYNYISNNKLSTDSAQRYFNNLSVQVKKSRTALVVHNLINARIVTVVGKRAPLFTKMSVDNKEVNLEAFIKKGYVLLDFWASWCAPCREESPQVDSLYRKYKSKGLNLIGISLDVDQQAWKDAIANDHISAWNHVNMDRLSGAIRDQYYIGAIPLLILIDPKGIIVGKYLGNDAGGTIGDLARDLEKRLL